MPTVEENTLFLSFIKNIGGLIRNILPNCFFCNRQNAKPVQSQMANLPNIHLQSHIKPFSITGDYHFRPFQAKIYRKTRRN